MAPKPLSLEELAEKVGYAPGQLPRHVKITDERRSAIRKFARKNYGVPSAITSGLYGHKAMTTEELRRFWNADHDARMRQADFLKARFDPDLAAQHQPAPSKPSNTSKSAQEPQTVTQDTATQAAAAANAANAADPSAQLVALIGQIAGQSVNEDRVKELIAEHAPQHASPVTLHQIDVTAPEPRTVAGLTHYATAQIVRVVQHTPVYLVGPAGSGKTHMATQVAEALGVSFHFNGALDTKYALTGFVDAHGNYRRTQFREAYEHGGVFLFDELDASNPAAVLAFNAALSNGHMDFPDGRVEQHPECYIIAAANTYGRGADRVYVGRNPLDAASLDRFAQIEIDYDENLERALAGNDAWTRNVQAVRRAVADLNVRQVISPRASMKGAAVLADGIAWPDAERMFLFRGLDTDTTRKIANRASEYQRAVERRQESDDGFKLAAE